MLHWDSSAALQQVPREAVEYPSAEIFKAWLDRDLGKQMHIGDSPASGKATKIPSKPVFL